jgi:metal-dependent hydrolase (beta-lactamase superfamily II)
MFPAEDGDSILINCYGKESTKILVDCGTSATYYNYIKDYLINLPKQQRKLDLIIFTHLHQDHIQGGIELFKDKKNLGDIQIKEIWQNGFKHIPFTNISGNTILNQEDNKKLEEILLSYRNSVFNGFSKHISASQNMDLEDLIPDEIWNKSFMNSQNSEVCFENKNVVQLNKEIILRILSPSKRDLENLECIFITELKKKYKSSLSKDKVISKLFERIISQYYEENDLELYKSISFLDLDLEEYLIDDSANATHDYVNKSSIAFVLEFNKRKYLFMGDCYSSQITEEIKRLYKTEDGKVFFDAIKVAHHGSKFNTQKEFLEVVDSYNYFISTDGSKHVHPDIETLARIVCRPSKATRKLIFNYETEISKKMSDKSLCDKYNYSIEVTNDEKFILTGEE